MTEEKVLVFGDDTRSFLTIARSLGRKGITVHSAPSNFRSPALRSRYISKVHDLPPWLGDGLEWLHAITHRLQAETYDLVVPCNEITLLPLQRHRKELSRVALLAIPDDRAIAVLFDKHKTRELARHIGLPLAAGRLAGPGDRAETILAEFGRRVVVKPRWSYSLERLAARGKAELIQEPARLARVLSEASPNSLLFEEFFSGQGVGVSVLASRGRLLQAFEHHRVHEVAGASFYRCSASLSSDLVLACEAITTALEYTGVAMFEFKRNAQGDWVLLEVNARPWGSMPLPVALGVDFPYRWYRLLVAGEETPSVSYRTGVYGRNLIPDLRQTLAELQEQHRGPVARGWFALGRFAELFRILIGREVHDGLVWDDPRPGLVELLELIRAVATRLQRFLPGEVGRCRRRARAKVQRFRNSQGKRVIFVCQGNICRSPFAEALFRARIGDYAVETNSAGMMPQPGRLAPALAIEAAAAHGVDLSMHRSAWLSRQMTESASLIIVFDEINHTAVLDRYPDLKVPIIRLGHLAGVGDLRDPIDGDSGIFAEIYRQIAVAIEELAALVQRSRNRAP